MVLFPTRRAPSMSRAVLPWEESFQEASFSYAFRSEVSTSHRRKYTKSRVSEVVGLLIGLNRIPDRRSLSRLCVADFGVCTEAFRLYMAVCF